VQAEVVKAKDTFEYQGVGKAPIHKMNPFGDRGDVIGVYCVAKLSSGEFLSTVMSKQDCDAIRDKSSSAAKSGPWKDFYEEMLKKTVIKRASKLWPKSERVQQAVEVLNEHEGIEFGNKSAYVDPASFELPEPTEKDFSDLKTLLTEKKRDEAGLLKYINTQFKSDAKTITELNAAQIDSAFRALGGRPVEKVGA
jgi:recombinational DNA repair protein RecT